MKQEIKDKLPQWYNDLNELDAVITNDIDSLLGYYFIKKKFPNVGVKGFYNFNEYYNTGSKKKAFGVDLDVIRGRTFGNHITHFYKNPDAINLNNLYNIKYYQKYPLNTVLLILSLYDFDLESFTDEQLKIILAIDSAHTGYYASNEHFKNVYTTWLDRLDIRFLEDRILKNMTFADFKAIQNKYNLNGTIEVVNNKLYTNINLGALSLALNDIIELPKDSFKKGQTYTYQIIDPMQEAIPDREDIISMAWTYKDTLKLTLR